MPTLYLRLAIVAVIATGGFLTGWWVNGWRHDAIALERLESDQRAIQAAVEQAKKIAALRDERIETAALLEIERRKKAKITERVVTKEVTKYVQTRPVIQCLDSDGLRIHDTAAVGLPETENAASEPDAETGGASNAEILQVVTLNYSICHDTENQLLALQDWVRALE